jgi:hypothetical protein
MFVEDAMAGQSLGLKDGWPRPDNNKGYAIEKERWYREEVSGGICERV